MATNEELKTSFKELETQIKSVNDIGVSNLYENGVTLSADATTYDVMNGIDDIERIEPVDYTVEFKFGGLPYEVVSVKSGHLVKEPNTPQITAGVFYGWGRLINGKVDESTLVTFPYKPFEDVELHALVKTVRDELEIDNTKDLISSAVGYKLHDGTAIYGLAMELLDFAGRVNSGYLISKKEEAVLTTETSHTYSLSYGGVTWYYSNVRTTKDKSTYTDGTVEPYFAGDFDGNHNDAVTNILDYYFMKIGTDDLPETPGTPETEVDFWDVYQDNGNRTDYAQGFAGVGWKDEIFKPKYDIRPTNAYMLFQNAQIEGDLVSILSSLGVVLDTSKATNTMYMFAGCTNITRIGVIDFTASVNSVATDSFARGCTNLQRIEKFVINANTKFAANTFNACPALQYIGFEGAISNSIYLQYSPLLTAECIQGIIDHLATVTTAQTITLHASIVLSDEQKTTISNKGWTLVQ